MFKITIIGIDGELLRCVEQVGKIEYINSVHHVFTASFDGCIVKVDGCLECVRIINPARHSRIILAKCQFEEIIVK